MSDKTKMRKYFVSYAHKGGFGCFDSSYAGEVYFEVINKWKAMVEEKYNAEDVVILNWIELK